jgi:hypothetical protein
MAIKQLASCGSPLNSGLDKEDLQNPGKMGQIITATITTIKVWTDKN